MLRFSTISELVAAADKSGQKISALTLSWQAEQAGMSEGEVFTAMQKTLMVMEQSVTSGIEPGLRSMSGLSGGDAFLLERCRRSGGALCGDLFADALTRALAVAEYNSAMGQIVAAPTAGSCGILPAAILSLRDARALSEQDCVMALFTASAVGMVIAKCATLSGAEGGCQAECGSASAMAAAALVELAGGTPAMIENAVAIALKSVLGLVCDPVAGLVEIPCIKRNAAGVATAFTAAQLALAGISSAIPADEVIITMKRVGDALPSSLKETSDGGLAATPTGRALCRRVFGEK